MHLVAMNCIVTDTRDGQENQRRAGVKIFARSDQSVAESMSLIFSPKFSQKVLLATLEANSRLRDHFVRNYLERQISPYVNVLVSSRLRSVCDVYSFPGMTKNVSL